MTPERYAKIKELFLAATELSPSERDQFLNQRCDGDEQLRHQVQELLGHHSSQTILQTDQRAKDTVVEEHSLQSAKTIPDVKRTLNRSRRIPILGPWGQLATGAAIVGVLLMLFGIWQRASVHRNLEQNLHDRINALLDGHVESFEHWARYQRRMVEYWAQDEAFKNLVRQLVDLNKGDSEKYSSRLRNAPEQNRIRRELRAAGGRHTQYVVFDMQQRILAEGPEKGPGLGKMASTSAMARLAPVFRGKTIMFVDEIQDVIHPEYPAHNDYADVFVAAPVRDEQGSVFAVVTLFNVDSAVMENSIRSTASIMDTSETYAFGLHGLMLSESRFNDELLKAGLLDPETKSSLNVVLHDPGGDLTAGFRSTKSMASRPLTHMARHALAGENGSDMNGYRNYLGRTVVGAWRWLPEYEIGFAMEVSKAEAYEPLKYLRRQFLISFGLLTLSVIGILFSSFWITRLRRQIGADRQLGQYTLEELIGEGGMGQVYRARHALLKRPCAVKVLKPELSDSRSLAWFEREVQSASSLNHPNTIRIFDYGATAQGNFYFAMEYLQGIDLEQLVKRHGPLPWQRAVYLIRQICRSLREAHDLGMVHRDIKPKNIMVCNRGGEADFVNVLDFGLAKQTGPTAKNQTATLAGTPVYMAPERWLDPTMNDPRSDIYSVGAVIYRLLTGREIFESSNSVQLVELIVAGEITPLSQTDISGLPRGLDELTMSCLCRDISSRPEDVNQILDALEKLPDEDAWNQSKAKSWWQDSVI